MAYDSTHNVDVLFGGLSSAGVILADTWTWNGTNWTEQFPATSPPARFDAMMAYDSALGETILFGGFGSGSGDLADTWAWNGSTWTELSPTTSPSAREASTMVYDPSISELVLFGGYENSSDTTLSSTWTFNGTTWTHLTPATSPAGRSSAYSAYDSYGGDVVLFGGNSSTGSLLDDTWTFNGTTWAEQSPYASPTARQGGGIAFDPTINRVVLFGGSTAAGIAADSYIWNPDAGSWEVDANDVVPADREYMVVAQAAGTQVEGQPASKGQLVLFGGISSGTIPSGALGDTQLFDWLPRGASDRDQYWHINIDDRTSLQVDLGTGNLYLQQNGLSYPGTGLDVDTFAYYNSQGSSWGQPLARGVNLYDGPDGDIVIDGVNGSSDSLVFTPKTGGGFNTQPGADSVLVYNSGTSTYTLTFNQSQTSLTFSAPVAGSFGPGLVTAEEGRNANTVTVAGADTTATTVTDTRSRTLTYDYTAGGGSTGTETWTGPDSRTTVETVNTAPPGRPPPTATTPRAWSMRSPTPTDMRSSSTIRPTG
jgi:hypothetical protein